MDEIIWRGWQKYLIEYLDKPCDRKIKWVFGVDGNEGKSFFQRNILKSLQNTTWRKCTKHISYCWERIFNKY